MKVPQRRLITEIESEGYAFSSETKRQKTFRQRGGTHHISIRKTVMVEGLTARSILRQAGRSPDQIETFIKSCQEDVS